MAKATDEDKARFRDLLPDGPAADTKPMFGGVGAFVNGNIYACLYAGAIGVKLDPDGLAELAAMPGSAPFGPETKPMTAYAAIPADLADDEASAWLARGRDHVAAFPAKRT